ncbi:MULTISPECIES: cell division protein SepF [Sporosarcina]|uniref:cell division protein SepF n=1 Tax=Sporosarcina TaxID=1569 RepID=UPI00129BA736|nr:MULTISPECIES: cell division protein SepF [Sporosarcina]GKV64266.1 cell division protein SepF [Sporosarcina sp. NCCP-2331]GLB54270.1 cell division protein SepF [Sporosarcina sp. NCCP-2378]
MSLKKRFEKLFWLEEEETVTESAGRQPIANQPPARKEPKKTNTRKQVAEPHPSTPVISLQSVQKSSKVILVEPRAYAEAQDIAEHLKNKRSVVVNLQRIDRDQGFRIIDFLSGTVYALGGDIQRVGTDIFLCAPENVEVAGSITEYLSE